MNQGKKSVPCPLCGGKKKPATAGSRAALRAGEAVISPASATGSETSDDATANDFAEFLLKPRRERL